MGAFVHAAAAEEVPDIAVALVLLLTPPP